ncbi:hypothetical protein [Halobacillus litoralis]|uniref:hypothetical protein n=1 Tax=Halobacillus litoralis TaxID=45668 RepID=UPI001CD47B6E|nr:hypothetical protein [Halobacillus litoralis]MCA1020891.1 hypothetical protein [Halobacillus litoralis]
MENRPFNWTALILFAAALGIWLYSSFGIIHSEHLEEAEVTKKTHNDEGYYVTIDDKKVSVKDTSTWMLLEEGGTYNITYEWYGMKKPYVAEVNQAHDDDQVGGH